MQGDIIVSIVDGFTKMTHLMRRTIEDKSKPAGANLVLLQKDSKDAV